MPNAAYDDENSRVSDDDLRRITGNNSDEEAALDDSAGSDSDGLSSDELADRESDTDSSSSSDAEQDERDKVDPESSEDSGFNYRTEKASSRKDGKKGGSSSKTGVAVGIGILGFIGILIIIMVTILSQLKVIHFGEILAATGYARFNGITQERMTQNLFDAAVVEGDGSAQLRGRSLVDRIKLRNVDKQIAELGREGKFSMNIEGDQLKSVKFESGEVSVDGLSKDLFGKESYKDLKPRERLTVRSEFTNQLKSSVGENLAMEPRYVQGRIFGTIADNVGFKFSRWRNAGRDLLGKKPIEAISDDTANSVKENGGDTIESGSGTIDEATKEYKNEERIKANVEKNGGVFDKQKFTESIVKDMETAGKIQDITAKISAVTVAVSIACMANQTFAHVDEMAQQNEKSASNMGLQVLAARDQVKAGKVTSEAVNTADAKLAGAESSAAYQYQTNRPVNLEKAEQPKIVPSIGNVDPSYIDIIKNMTSPSRYSGIGAIVGLFPGGQDKLDEADEKFCGFVLSPEGALVMAGSEIVATVVAGVLSGGGAAAGEQAAGRAATQIAITVLKETLFETVKGVFSAKSLATLGGFTAYALGLQLVASALSGSTFSGAEQGAAYYDRAAVGTNVMQNRQVRSQYGRPLEPDEASGVDKQYAADLRNTWNKKDFTTRYFAAENPFSLAGMASAYTPSTASSGFQLIRRGFSNLGSIFKPLSIGPGLSLIGANSKVYAAEANSYNPYGDQVQWGFSPSELAKMRDDETYTIRENPNHISEAQISRLDGTIGKCFDPARSQYDVNKDPDCTAGKLGTEEALRYRIYKLDDSMASLSEEDLSKATQGGSSSSSSTTPAASTPAGTDAVGYENGVQKNIKIVTVNDTNDKPVLKVNSEIAENITKLIAAAKQAGLTLSADSTFRTNEEQQYLWDCYQSKQCNNGNQAAKPGYSNHQMGYALDFVCDNATESDEKFGGTSCFAWLKQNAGQFGLKNLPSEAWHWSKNGN